MAFTWSIDVTAKDDMTNSQQRYKEKPQGGVNFWILYFAEG